MPDLFYPALGMGFWIGISIIGWIVGTQLKHVDARDAQTGAK